MTRRCPTTSRDESSSATSRSPSLNGPSDVNTAASNGPASAGIVSDRSPSPSSTCSPLGASHSKRPGRDGQLRRRARSSAPPAAAAGSPVGASTSRASSTAAPTSGSRWAATAARSGRTVDTGGDGRPQRRGPRRDGLVDGVAHRLVPGRRHHADRQVRRRGVDGLGGVREAARQVEAVAGAQRQVQRRLAELVERRHRLLRPGAHGLERAGQRLPHPPPLAARRAAARTRRGSRSAAPGPWPRPATGRR